LAFQVVKNWTFLDNAISIAFEEYFCGHRSSAWIVQRSQEATVQQLVQEKKAPMAKRPRAAS